MHIAFLTPEYSRETRPEGGLANYLYKVGQELTRRGHQVTILCLSGANRVWLDQEVYVFEIERFTFHYRLKRAKVLASFLTVIAQVFSAKRLERALWRVHRERSIDIVQASSYKSPGYTFRGNPKLPLVCRISSYAALIRSAEGRRRTFGDYLSDWLEIRQVLDAQAAFAPSQLMSDAYARLEGFRPSIIRTPIDDTGIQTDDAVYQRKFAGYPYLLYFGTLKLVKGVDLLAEVIAPVLENHPGLRFAFIGRDDGLNDGQKIFEYIRSINSKYGDRLVYHPTLPKANLYPIIAQAEGVLMPSRMDNCPNACLEAQALKVPVIGTYNSSLDEMIVDGKTGYLAQNGDSASLISAIERLLALTPEKKEMMRAEIGDFVQASLAEDRVGQLLHYYQEIIEQFHLRRKFR